MRKTIIITAIVVAVTSAALVVFVRLTSKNNSEDFSFTEVIKGNFEIVVSGTGELVSEHSTDVRGPNLVQNMNFRPSPVRLTDIVPEGTIVRKGDYIATLDRSSFSNTLKDESDVLVKLRSDFEMKVLDTAVTLSNIRDDIRNQYFLVEEASITLEQSKFEPPAVQRQAKLELEKAERFMEYKQRLYNLRMSQTSAETRALKSSLDRQKQKVNDLQAILDGFIVKAPSDGIVMYKKDRTGVKRKPGSMISPFDPVIATLPDLNSLLSRLYVSETEITRIKPGQSVQISVDAFKDKTFTGKVASIANIGEQLENSDSKVFEVLVRISGYDPGLRPSMTTSNRVIIKTFDDVLYVPGESVHATADSISYVYTRSGNRQVVILGEANDRNIIIEQGLPEGESVWLNRPENASKFRLAGDDLIPLLKERARARKLGQDFFSSSNNGNSGSADGSGGQ